MQLSRRLIGPSFRLLSAISAAAALDLQTDGIPKGLSFLSAPAPAPTSATTPVSACVTQCVNDALTKGGCTSLADTLCFCANLAVTATLSQCVQRACPEDEHSVFTLYTDTCATLPRALPGLGSILPPDLASASSQSLAASAPAMASHTTSDTQPVSSASQATPDPAATTSSAAPTSSANPGVVSSDPAGTQVTVTATSASASASALNPTVNGAARAGCSVFGTSLALLVAAWSL